MRHSILAISVSILWFSSSATDGDTTKIARPLETDKTIAVHDSDDVVIAERIDTLVVASSDSLLTDSSIAEIEAFYYSDELVSFDLNEVPVTEELYRSQMDALGFDVPMDYNHLVKTQIDFFATRWQPTLKRMITLSQVYFPIYESILLEEGTPQEIKYLSIVESALNPKAISRSGAVGPWQFMPVTGRIYKLANNYNVDERRSVEKSTRAACTYLNAMYRQFGDWQVAIASYNCGPGNVRKAMKRSGRSDFWGMYSYLPRETQNYVPKFIAMAYLMNYYADYGITPTYIDDLKTPYHQVRCHSQMTFDVISDHIEMTQQELLNYNPELKRPVIPYVLGEYFLNIPEDKVNLFQMHEENIVSLSKLQNEERLAQEQAKEVIYYTVKKSESLPIIARRFGCTVSQLKEWNGISGSIIHPNQRLRIERN